MKNDLINKARQESSTGKNVNDKQLLQFVREYDKTISVPKQKLHAGLLVCPVGLTGAGKSTVIKPIAQALDLVRISGDEIRILLMNKGFNTVRTIEVAFQVYMKYLHAGYGLAIDSDVIDPFVRKELKKIIKAKKLNAIWIHINPPEKFIINKLTNFKYKPNKGFKNAEEALANYQRRKPLHKKYLPGMKFDYTFDTSKKNVGSEIRRCVTEIKKSFISLS